MPRFKPAYKLNCALLGQPLNPEPIYWYVVQTIVAKKARLNSVKIEEIEGKTKVRKEKEKGNC